MVFSTTPTRKIDRHIYLDVSTLNQLQEIQAQYKARTGNRLTISQLLEIGAYYLIEDITRIAAQDENKAITKLKKLAIE